jgi:recombination protein RecA
MSSKLDIVNRINAKLNNAHARNNPGSEPLVFLAAGNEKLLDFGLIPTGNPAIDQALGGGLPRGTISQLTGEAGVGKSRQCLDTIAYNQKLDPDFLAMFVHLEARAFPLKACLEAGVDLNRLLVVNAQASGEKTFDIMLQYLWDFEKKTPVGAVDLVIIDSVAAAVPAQELGVTERDGLEAMTVGAQARMMSKTFRILTGTGALGKTHVLIINQIRTDINSYGGGQTNPGGNAVKFYPKVTIHVRAPRGQYKKVKVKGEGEQITGHTVLGEVVKNNAGYGHPHATFEYVVYYGKGVDMIPILSDAALNYGLVVKKGGWFAIPSIIVFDEKKKAEVPLQMQGEETLHEWIREHPAFQDLIQDTVAGVATEETLLKAPTVLPEEVADGTGDLLEA